VFGSGLPVITRIPVGYGFWRICISVSTSNDYIKRRKEESVQNHIPRSKAIGEAELRRRRAFAPIYRCLTLNTESLMWAGRTSEAAALAERFEIGWWYAELHRLRGVFLAALGAEEAQIDACFCEAIRIAREQKSIFLEKRAEGTYAEYRRQKASGSGGRGFRLPLW
jgi:hypothetical protein